MKLTDLDCLWLKMIVIVNLFSKSVEIEYNLLHSLNFINIYESLGL